MDVFATGYLVFGLAGRFFTMWANFRTKTASRAEIKFYVCGLVSYVFEIIHGIRSETPSHIYMGAFTLAQNAAILAQTWAYQKPAQAARFQFEPGAGADKAPQGAAQLQ